MNLILIRHTRIHNPNNICYGQYEIDLSNSFPRELEELQKNLSEFLLSPENSSRKIGSIYSSPSKRCTLLAEKLRKSLNIDTPIIRDERLMEYNFGDWEGISWDDIPETESSDWMKDFVNTPPPNGEIMTEFSERVEQFLLDIKNVPTNEDNFKTIITHGGWIRIAMAKKLNIPLQKIFEIEVDYGSITLYEL
ncbi:MAG: histidine phosphatase family protein [Leptospira sp.]|nr:histidine phosphatase family protein [Leptospira sp.]